MPESGKRMNWPVNFIPTADNSIPAYAAAIIKAFKSGEIDYVIPMPEALQFDGLVDEVEKAGFGDRIAGLSKAGAFMEGDKIAWKRICQKFGIPVADEWREVDARDYAAVLNCCLIFIDKYGGAVMKYPYSAAGKGSRIILDAWQIKEVYDTLMAEYGKKTKKGEDYVNICGDDQPWPLLIESRMSGVEISFHAFVDRNGNHQLLPTAQDYPERFEGPASKDNPITGGMASISPHPLESAELMEMASHDIIGPTIKAMRELGILRPCILYPGCFISVDGRMKPLRIRKCEKNIRIGDPEGQPIFRRVRNPGQMIIAMFEGRLDEVKPEVRQEQLALCIALVTGPGGPDGQKGYPWSCTKDEPMVIDFDYLKKGGIQLIPTAMAYDKERDIFLSDGTRVIYMNANAAMRPGETMADAAERLREKLLRAFDEGKIRVIPRENPQGNRLALRRDAGKHYLVAEKTFSI